MKTTHSLIIGACIVVAAVLHGVLTKPEVEEQTGRYQITGSSGVNVFVMDTATGQLWSKHFVPDSGSTQWSLSGGPWATSLTPEREDFVERDED